MKTVRQNYRVDRRRISMLRFIFEAYEGVAVVTTIDAALGHITLGIAPGCEAMVESILTDLKRHFLIEPYDDTK